MVGGFLDPSVPRSPGVAPQEGRAAHGPRHPALPIPLRLVRGFDRLLYCALLVFCVSFVLVISSWGLICCMVISPFRTRPLSVRVFAPLFSLCLVGSPSTFSFFVSSGAGETQTLLWFVFPLVFLRPGRALRLQPVPHGQHVPQGSAPAPVFCVCV